MHTNGTGKKGQLSPAPRGTGSQDAAVPGWTSGAAGGEGSLPGDPRGSGKDRWGLGREPAQLVAFWPQGRAGRVSHCRLEVGRITSWCPRKRRIFLALQQPHPRGFRDWAPSLQLGLGCSLQWGSALDLHWMGSEPLCTVGPATGCCYPETTPLLYGGLSIGKSLRKAPFRGQAGRGGKRGPPTTLSFLCPPCPHCQEESQPASLLPLSYTMSLPGSHRKLQCQLNSLHPPKPQAGYRPGFAKKNKDRHSSPLPGSGPGKDRARSSVPCLCSVAAEHPHGHAQPLDFPACSNPSKPPHPDRQRRPPAHGDQVPALHDHVAGRCFLGGQPQSHGGLDKARFHPDVRPLLPPPAAPHPTRRPGAPRRITAGPSAPGGPSSSSLPSLGLDA